MEKFFVMWGGEDIIELFMDLIVDLSVDFKWVLIGVVWCFC